jgi:hypothetical protein
MPSPSTTIPRYDDPREIDSAMLFAAAEASFTGAPWLLLIGPEADHPELYVPQILPSAAFDTLSPCSRALFLSEARAALSDYFEQRQVESDDPDETQSAIGKWGKRLRDGDDRPIVRLAFEFEDFAGSLREFGRKLDRLTRQHPALTDLHMNFADKLAVLDFIVDQFDEHAEMAASGVRLASASDV